MRILILGAGALGGYFGARLLAAGRDVTFLVRPGTAKLLAENGLRVFSPQGDLSIERPPMVLAADLHEPFDVILLSCKAYDLGEAMDSIAPAVGPDTVILPMLNGMAHMAALDGRFGSARVLGGTCFISAVREAEGAIRHLNDRDEFFFGERHVAASERMQGIAAALTDAGFDGQLRPAILEDMWGKWSFLATLAGITCMMRATIGDAVAVDARLPARFYEECVDIARGEGFPPSQTFYEKHRAILTRPGSDFTASMLRDLEDGAAIESHQILGDLLEHGQRQGLQTPLLAMAYAHVRCYEVRRAREGRR